MKFLDHRARPHSRAVKLTRSTLDSISTATMAPGGAWFAVPQMALLLEQDWVWEAGAALAIGGVWVIADAAGACGAGLTHGNLIMDAWSHADELRNAYPSSTVAGWGIIDRTDVTAGDCLRLGTANPYGYAWKLSDPSNPFNDPIHPWDSYELSSAAFNAMGYNLPLAGGSGAEWVTFDDGGWRGIGIEQIGTLGEARVLVYPRTWTGPTITGNFIGSSGIGGYQGDPVWAWAHSNLGARVMVSSAQALSHPEWMRLIPDGATITGARLQVTVSDLVRRTVTVESELDGTTLSTSGSDADDEEDCGVALLHCVRSGTGYSWNVMAVSGGGNAQSGKTLVVDGMDFVTALLGDKASTFHAYAVVPSPAVEALANATNTGWLWSLKADIEMGYMSTGGDDQPILPELGPKAVFPGGSYVKKSTARSVSWGDVSVGWFSVDFTVPGSLRTRTITAPWPTMGSPALG